MMKMEQLKSLSREERTDYFKSHKRDLMELSLEAINGGMMTKGGRENPNSSCPYNNCYYTSFGWICDGYKSCG
jgi:hypothetical protein